MAVIWLPGNANPSTPFSGAAWSVRHSSSLLHSSMASSSSTSCGGARHQFRGRVRSSNRGLISSPLALPLTARSFPHLRSRLAIFPNSVRPFVLNPSHRAGRTASVPEHNSAAAAAAAAEEVDVVELVEGEGQDPKEEDAAAQRATVIDDAFSPRNLVTVAACVVGLLTGVGVVLFNMSVHEIRDFFWDGIPSRGASWLREEPVEEVWQRVILVPVCGGVIVGILNSLQNSLRSQSEGILPHNIKSALGPFLKTIAASVTLGTGNSLGPEGPSVEIGSAIAKGVGHVFEWSGGKRLSLVAAGSAAGIASGFNAAVAGCFFAVESVLWPSSTDSFSSLTNATPMVILSSVIASVVSEIGLGSDPAFKVPDYDFRSPSELPLYLLLGLLCGLVSITLSACTSFFLELVANFHKVTGTPKAVFPALGGLTVGLMALSYPEILYWGFENVDVLLESRPFVNGLPFETLFELVGVKIIATALSRASGLVGGYYAPSLFIGAATGMAYGKFVRSTLCGPNPLFHLSLLEVASPQAYGLVGMAATLAGVCQVPLTSVLLLFELTRDYRIVLPLLGAVGLSSWIASSQKKKQEGGQSRASKVDDTKIIQSKDSQNNKHSISTVLSESSIATDLCELESSFCAYDTDSELDNLVENLTVSEAMKTRYVTIRMDTSIVEAVSLMLAEKQSCAVIIDNGGFPIGLLVLEDVQDVSRFAKSRGMVMEVDKILVSHICNFRKDVCRVWTVTPSMTLLNAKRIMDSRGVNQLPVVAEHDAGHKRGHLIGLLDRECIRITVRAVATKEFLSLPSVIKRPDS